MKERKYTIDTEVTFSLGIGFVSRQQETRTVGEWLELDASDMKTWDDDEIEGALYVQLDHWKYDYIDYGISKTE